MAEKKVFIQSRDIKIEGLLDSLRGEAAVVVTHPHPLYGGDMYNNVVESVVGAYRERNYTTFRFNFRGVGESEGRYDQGIGEQSDVHAALDFLDKKGKSSIDLVGYSFGAWVNAMAVDPFSKAARIVMISPPVNFIDFSFLQYNPKIRLVITGSEDDIAPPRMIRKLLAGWSPEIELQVIEGADHFFWGKTGEIKRKIWIFLDSGL